MFRKILVLLVLLLLLVAALIPSVLAAPDGSRLRDISGDLLIGYASRNNFWNMSDSAQYEETARTEFNFMTPENAMKWDAIHPAQNSYSFSQADQHVQFAQANGMAVHGHVLVWHSQNPSWLQNGSWSRSQLIDIMYDHIDTVAGHFAGDVLVWDVVNEAFNEDGTYRSSIWRDGIGQEYIDLAFERAHLADPNAKLIYNDYNIGWTGSKSNGVYNMAADMVSRGVPIDGVGFQMHLTDGGVDANSFASNMQRFADLGLEVYITELDVRIPQNPSQQALQNQAAIYQTVTERCLAQPACKGLQVWGIPDKYSWVPDVFPGTGAPLLFDDNYNAKPAYYAVQTALKSGNPPLTPTSTPAATSLPPTTTPPPGGACVVDYALSNSWSNVFQANVTVTNNQNAPIAGWTLEFTHADGQTATGGWNADISQSGNQVTISNPASYWNGNINANGGSVSFGLQGTFTGSVVIPTDFVLNGSVCNQGDTPVTPTATAVPPTVTTVPPTATSIPPTATTIPPTATTIPPTATSVPPTTTSIPPTATSQPVGICSVNYAVTNDWGSGFTANIALTNLSSTDINGWTLEFTFPGSQSIGNAWGGTVNQMGQTIIITDSGWNAYLAASGGSTSVGFQAAYAGVNEAPSSFTLNGVPCQ